VSGRAGVELTPQVVRVVRLAPYTRRVAQTIEIPWDPLRPADAVAALRSRAGRPRSISLAVGLGFLEVMRVDLPPVAPDERVRMIDLEPDRFFAAAGRESLVTTLAPESPIAFGAPAALIAAWIAAFETWAPVDWVEPAPIATARVLARQRDGAWRIEAGEDETGVLQIEHGRIASVRRARDAAAGSGARAVPAIAATPAPFAAALGAAKWQPRDARGVPSLAAAPWRRRLAARRRTAIAAAAILAIMGIVFAIWAADRWRERTLAALEDRISRIETQAAPADTALRMLRSREAEAATIGDVVTNRADPFGALAAISAALPREATVLSARASGNLWQIDGTTSDASTLVPRLDRHARFDSVRFLSASSRYRDANRSYETFSIALRFRPQP